MFAPLRTPVNFVFLRLLQRAKMFIVIYPALSAHKIR